MEKSKYVNFRLPVYSIDESIELYNKGKIDFFIIPMAYHEEYQESMIRDLLENGIHVTDILLFPVKVTEKIKIDKLMNLREFEQYYPQWENKYGIERKKEIITEYNLRGELSEKYEIVLIGEGWLYNYVSSIGCECNIGAKKATELLLEYIKSVSK